MAMHHGSMLYPILFFIPAYPDRYDIFTQRLSLVSSQPSDLRHTS